jgi:hypothetical protein
MKAARFESWSGTWIVDMELENGFGYAADIITTFAASASSAVVE